MRKNEDQIYINNFFFGDFRIRESNDLKNVRG